MLYIKKLTALVCGVVLFSLITGCKTTLSEVIDQESGSDDRKNLQEIISRVKSSLQDSDGTMFEHGVDHLALSVNQLIAEWSIATAPIFQTD